MPRKDDVREAVLELLENLRGMEPLKKLFWSTLNYERENELLSQHRWPDSTSELLAEDPVLLASGGYDNSFHVIYCQLAERDLRIGHERRVVDELSKDHRYALFVFSNNDLTLWHLVNIPYDDDPSRRRVYRRITVGEAERFRTATERISMLDLESLAVKLGKGIDELSSMDIQSRHDEAFSVEKVTDQFFRKYRQVFEYVEARVQGIDESEDRRLFVQRLFNRLMFVAFVEKKGWLKLDSQTDYLHALWATYKRNRSSDEGFYKDRLKRLFFSGFNSPDEREAPLIRILLFKRFESSVYAFRETVARLIRVHRSFIGALDEGIVPAGEQSQRLLYESDTEDETDFLDALRAVTGDYAADDFDTDLLKAHLEQDIRLLEKIKKLVEPITPEKDAKLQTLREKLAEPGLRDGKRLIFTQYADTARYLHENLNPGGRRHDVEVIYSGDKSKDLIVGRFAPKANPEINTSLPEIDTLVATDVLSEGLNMQDCDKIISYDLHWNPVRLVQRFGRIDRIGSEHDEIYGFNFLPETGIEENLGLKEKLTERIKEIQQTIGEDAAILDPSEKLNPEAMYAIYGQDEAHLSELEDEQESIVDLNEVIEMFLQLRDENPGEYERIAKLRDGIRSALPSEEKGLYVFCKAGHYQQLYLVDESGDVVSRDTSRLLKTINCEPDEPTGVLPDGYNASVMRVKEMFVEEVKRRTSERRHRQTLSPAQRYALDELQRLFNATEEVTQRDKLNALTETFRRPLSSAVQRELRRLRQRKLGGKEIARELERIYSKYGLSEAPSQQPSSRVEHATPRVVCSEALV
jgi:hypothetical protein